MESPFFFFFSPVALTSIIIFGPWQRDNPNSSHARQIWTLTAIKSSSCLNTESPILCLTNYFFIILERNMNWSFPRWRAERSSPAQDPEPRVIILNYYKNYIIYVRFLGMPQKAFEGYIFCTRGLCSKILKCPKIEHIHFRFFSRLRMLGRIKINSN